MVTVNGAILTALSEKAGICSSGLLPVRCMFTVLVTLVRWYRLHCLVRARKQAPAEKVAVRNTLRKFDELEPPKSSALKSLLAA